MLADIQQTIYPEEVTRQLHVTAQGRESSLVIERRPNHCDIPPLIKQISYYISSKPHEM